MSGVLKVMAPVQAFLRFDKVWIDNNIFRLHYKVI